MAAAVEFGLLGPLEVRRDSVLVPMAGGRERALLAALLLNAGSVVQADELIEVLWGSAPPASARASLYNYVKRLRKVLGDAAHDRIATQPQGYLIRVEPGGLDVTRFEQLLGAARTAARDSGWESAAGQARAALALWRGEPLADTGSEMLAVRAVPRLAEMRVQGHELAIDAELHTGRHAELVGELRGLVAAHPLRERLHALLMLALYRDNRQGEALGAYQDARRVLAQELGVEPGSVLRELHQQILTGAGGPRQPTVFADPGSSPRERPSLTAGTRSARAVVPRELPPGVRHFTGRELEMAALTMLLERASDDSPGTVVISAIGGTAGVGKTALAVQWAHQVAAQFPGGQLLTGATLGQTHRVLDALARVHLIQPAGAGHYAMHDLLRTYARELAEAQDAEDERRPQPGQPDRRQVRTGAGARRLRPCLSRPRRHQPGPPTPAASPRALQRTWALDFREIVTHGSARAGG